MDITTKKGRRGRKDIDRIIVEKGRRGDFSPLQPDHYHSFYEIFYLWSGSCRFLLKDTVYQMEAGDLVFIAPGELHHSLYSAGEVCEIVMIYFKEEYLHLSDRSADSLTSISGQGLQLHSFMGSVPTVYQEYLHSLLTRMLTENSRFDQYSEHFERCYLEELLLLLMRHSVMNEKEPDLLNSRDADILLATKYIYKATDTGRCLLRGFLKPHLFQQEIQTDHRHGVQGIFKLRTAQARPDGASYHQQLHHGYCSGIRLQRQQLF